MNTRKTRDGAAGPLESGEHDKTWALLEATIEINRGGKSYTVATDVELGYIDHPELMVVRRWLERIGNPDVSREMLVIRNLCRAVRSEWMSLPKLTKAEHEKLYRRVTSLCDQLRDALNETGHFYMRGGGWGLQGAVVGDLLTDAERSNWNVVLAGAGYTLESEEVTGVFPAMEDLLARLAAAAVRLQAQGPVHTQPNKRGAESGYFIRRMGELLMQRYAQRPMDVLAALATAVFDKDVDRELVAKLLKQPERSR